MQMHKAELESIYAIILHMPLTNLKALLPIYKRYINIKRLILIIKR